MNIFYLDKRPDDAAKMHCDKHCVKMILEYAQMLSTAHRVLDGDNVPDSYDGDDDPPSDDVKHFEEGTRVIRDTFNYWRAELVALRVLFAAKWKYLSTRPTFEVPYRALTATSNKVGRGIFFGKFDLPPLIYGLGRYYLTSRKRMEV